MYRAAIKTTTNIAVGGLKSPIKSQKYFLPVSTTTTAAVPSLSIAKKCFYREKTSMLRRLGEDELKHYKMATILTLWNGDVSNLEEALKQSEKLEMADKKIIEMKDEKQKSLQLQVDYLQGTLTSRYIMEKFEKEIIDPLVELNFKDKKFSRVEKWNYFFGTEKGRILFNELNENCGENNWSLKAKEVYHQLSKHIHDKAVEGLPGEFILRLSPINYITKDLRFFLIALGKELYGKGLKIVPDENLLQDE